jgi:cytochrome c-type biogenesis protein CcmF
VLTSVHAFATDPRRGIFILAFLTIVVGSSLFLYASRTSRIGLGGRFAVVSRESLLLTNNVLLAAAMGCVMLGTLYPLVLDALGLGKISVGPPYFESVFVPLMAPAVFLMGLGPLARWKKASLPELAVRLRWAAVISAAVAVLLPFTMGRWSPMVSFGLLLAVWVLATTVVSVLDRVKNASSPWTRLATSPRAWYGMLIAHLGIAVFVVGVTLVKGYELEKDVRMQRGDVVDLAGYEFKLEDIRELKGPNYAAARAIMTVTREGKPVTTMHPEKRVYTVQEMPMTEAAINPGLTRDLYVSLGDPLGGGFWLVRVHYKPFVSWIWIGCVIMALGGLLAATDRRYRTASRREAEAAYAALVAADAANTR